MAQRPHVWSIYLQHRKVDEFLSRMSTVTSKMVRFASSSRYPKSKKNTYNQIFRGVFRQNPRIASIFVTFTDSVNHTWVTILTFWLPRKIPLSTIYPCFPTAGTCTLCSHVNVYADLHGLNRVRPYCGPSIEKQKVTRLASWRALLKRKKWHYRQFHVNMIIEV